MTSSRLLRLPTEIRMAIYRHIPLKPERPTGTGPRGWPNTTYMALLLDCLPVLQEPPHTHLSSNHILLTDRRADYEWLISIGPNGQRMIRNVTIRISQTPNHYQAAVLQILSHCTNASLRFEGRITCLSSLLLRGDLMDLHGFAGVTVDNGYGIVECSGQMDSDPLPRDDLTEGLDRVVDHFMSACPAGCGVHGVRQATGRRTIVHIDATSYGFIYRRQR